MYLVRTDHREFERMACGRFVGGLQQCAARRPSCADEGG